MVKKKKPAPNPARGFATVSIASKPKPESLDPALAPTAETVSDTGVDSAPAVHANGERTEKERELHELSPEELEQRLEESDLRALVERYGPRSVRDSSRHVNKLQTDYRILRKQAQPLPLLGLLPSHLVQQVLDLAKDDVNNNNSTTSNPQARRLQGIGEEEVTAHLWTLQRALSSLGFEATLVERAIDHLLWYPPAQDQPNLVWGLEQALDWIFLNCEDVELPDVDDHTGLPRNRAGPRSESSTPAGTGAESEAGGAVESRNLSKVNSLQDMKKGIKISNTPPSSVDDVDVSDLDSDQDPDELLSAYLSAKKRLFETNPELVKVDGRRQKNSARSGLQIGDLKPTVTKLLLKMQKIEGDVLFDKREADERWLLMRNQLAQETADRRRLHLPTPSSKLNGKSEPPTSTAITPPDSADTSSDTEADDTSDDDNALGDLFASETGAENLARLSNDDSSHIVKRIRDFGPTTGVSPRRILEETCRARQVPPSTP